MHKKGFTMVELMIVIAIISILVTIILPKMSGSRDKAKLAACKANLRHICIAMEMYGNDNNGKMIPVLDPGPWTDPPTDWYTVAYLWNARYLSFYPMCPIGNEYALFQSANNNAWHGYNAVNWVVCCWDGGIAGGGTHAGLTTLMPAAVNGRVVDRDGP